MIGKNSRELSCLFLKSTARIGVIGVEINDLFEILKTDINISLLGWIIGRALISLKIKSYF
jgi:hypothetical protein